MKTSAHHATDDNNSSICNVSAWWDRRVNSKYAKPQSNQIMLVGAGKLNIEIYGGFNPVPIWIIIRLLSISIWKSNFIFDERRSKTSIDVHWHPHTVPHTASKRFHLIVDCITVKWGNRIGIWRLLFIDLIYLYTINEHAHSAHQFIHPLCAIKINRIQFCERTLFMISRVNAKRADLRHLQRNTKLIMKTNIPRAFRLVSM